MNVTAAAGASRAQGLAIATAALIIIAIAGSVALPLFHLPKWLAALAGFAALIPLALLFSYLRRAGVAALQAQRRADVQRVESDRNQQAIMRLLDDLLAGFVAQGRMKLPGSAYRPCYRLVP